jgi:AcrR family transcriptional regulator
VRRGARNRDAIGEALYRLIGAGELRPTAERVAERAGVQARTVFRHFEDMDRLHAELAARLRAEVRPLLQDPLPGADLATRARALVGRRARVYEHIAPYKRSADAQRWRSRFLAAQHAATVRELRALLLAALPELRTAPAPQAAAFELVTSFEAWERLRGDQHLGRERAREAMELAALALLATWGPPAPAQGPAPCSTPASTSSRRSRVRRRTPRSRASSASTCPSGRPSKRSSASASARGRRSGS